MSIDIVLYMSSPTSKSTIWRYQSAMYLPFFTDSLPRTLQYVSIDSVPYMSSPQATLQYEDITVPCTCNFPQTIMVLSIIFWFKVDYCLAILSYDGLVIWIYHSAMYLPLSTDNYGIVNYILVQSWLLFLYCVLRWPCNMKIS